MASEYDNGRTESQGRQSLNSSQGSKPGKWGSKPHDMLGHFGAYAGCVMVL